MAEPPRRRTAKERVFPFLAVAILSSIAVPAFPGERIGSPWHAAALGALATAIFIYVTVED